MINDGRRLSDLPAPERDEVRDALFGNDIDLDEETAEEILRSHGVSSDAMVDELRALMQERIRKNAAQGGKEVENENLLFFVRDITNYKRARSPDAVKPESWVKSLVDNTTATLFPNHATAKSYRNREDGDLSENDRKLIDEAESELGDEE